MPFTQDFFSLPLTFTVVVEGILRMIFIRVGFVQAIDRNRTGENDVLNIIFLHSGQYIARPLNIHIIVE